MSPSSFLRRHAYALAGVLVVAVVAAAVLFAAALGERRAVAPAEAVVPSVLDLSGLDAAGRLEAAGLGDDAYFFDALGGGPAFPLDLGIVVDQYPAAGSVVTTDEPIFVVGIRR